MNPSVRETFIGLAAASVSIIVVVALMEEGRAADFADASVLMLFAWFAPIVYLTAAPWMIVVYGVAGFLVYQQYRRVPARFLRYLVGAEAIVWLLFGMWCVANLLMR